MFFNWGGGGGGFGGPGGGGVSADITPAQRKSPLNPPPKTPPFFKFGSGGVFKHDIRFPRIPPPPPGFGDPRNGTGKVPTVPTCGPFVILSQCKALQTPETAGLR